MANKTRRRGVFMAASGLATVLSLGVCSQASADGIRDAKAKSGMRTQSGVSVDFSVIESLAPPSRNLLIPRTNSAPLRSEGSDEPVVLRPPPGIAPVLIPPGQRMSGVGNLALVRLRPPPGVRVTDLKPIAPAATPPAEKPIQMAKAEPAAKPPAPDVTAPAPSKMETPAAPPAPKVIAAVPKAAAPVAPSSPVPAAKPAAAPTPPPPPKAAAVPAVPATPAPPPQQAKAASPVPTPPAPKTAAPVTPPPVPVAAAPATPPAKPAAPVQASPAPPPVQPASPAPASASPAAETPAAGAPRSLLTPPPPEAKVASVPQPAVPTEIKPEPKAETAKPAEMQTASLPPPKAAPVSPAPDVFTISFAVGEPDVPGNASSGLQSLAQRMKKDEALRVQLLAFASDPEKSVSRSRRLSLERAVNVRKQLLAAGIDSTRIEVRALGEQSGDGAPDRVDAITSRR